MKKIYYATVGVMDHKNNCGYRLTSKGYATKTSATKQLRKMVDIEKETYKENKDIDFNYNVKDAMVDTDKWNESAIKSQERNWIKFSI